MGPKAQRSFAPPGRAGAPVPTRAMLSLPGIVRFANDLAPLGMTGPDERTREGLTGQNQKNCLAAEKLSSPLHRPFSPKLLIRMEI